MRSKLVPLQMVPFMFPRKESDTQMWDDAFKIIILLSTQIFMYRIQFVLWFLFVYLGWIHAIEVLLKLFPGDIFTFRVCWWGYYDTKEHISIDSADTRTAKEAYCHRTWRVLSWSLITYLTSSQILLNSFKWFVLSGYLQGRSLNFTVWLDYVNENGPELR